MIKPAFPDGHFYSPVVDCDAALLESDRLWGKVRRPAGIDLKDEQHEHLLREAFPGLMEGFDFESGKQPDDEVERFHDFNGQFERQDPRVAFCLLKMLRPRRIVEVGSGFSTLLMLDVNERFLNGQTAITCVEPYPRSFLAKAASAGRISLIKSRAQDVAIDTFTSLEAGDLLFVDSSHVAKLGSDVVRIILEVLPRLQPGVYVHFHDIFIPADYPRKWVELGFSWNEQYMLQAFLTCNPDFEIVYGSAIARELHPEALAGFLGENPPHGGSLWLRRVR